MFRFLPALILLLFSLATFNTLSAQSAAEKEQALELGRKAIELMDSGAYAESLELLEKAQDLDPDSPVYPYEIAYAYYLKKDYKKAIKAGKKALKAKEVSPQLYSMMGNIYDDAGDQKKAVKAYETGIAKFPQSPIYYVELGILEMRRENYDAAATYWESGIQVDPTYPSNYFHLANLFSNTDQHLWTVLYSEMFLNLEPGTARGEQIAQAIFDGYLNAIELKGDSASVTFAKDIVLTIEDLADPENFKLPAATILEMMMALGTSAVNGETDLNTTTLHQIRESFLQNWYTNNHHEVYPNPLIARMKAIADAGHLEAYNHFLFRVGDPVGWEFWLNEHGEEFDAFAEWFNNNPVTIMPGKGLTRATF